MGRSVAIICNGDFPRKAYPLYLIQMADFVVCCDGAAETFLRKCSGRLPDVVIGDMDSLRPSVAAKVADRVVKVDEQDTNDMAKALRYVFDNVEDVDKVTVLGASGKREDHMIGNMGWLMEFATEAGKRGVAMEAVSDYSTAFAMTDSGEIHCGEGRSISIFTCDPTLRIKSTGLTWPTDDVLFSNWWKATLNKASEDVVKLQLSHPAPVLIILN